MQMLTEWQKELKPKEETKAESKQQQPSTASAKTNQASRDGGEQTEAASSKVKDPFFDKSFEQELAEARALAADVTSQLGKKTKAQEEYAMPEESTDGMKPEEISNTVYSGESNIHYDLKNRYHRRMPIPVYLAKGGGRVVVSIWVNTSGKVVKAEIKSIENANDSLLAEYALQAAKRMLFNKDDAAPNLQQGYISYLFVAQ
ncbi:MAG: energy transducer TonB [Mangrovibacterium sp.]